MFVDSSRQPWKGFRAGSQLPDLMAVVSGTECAGMKLHRRLPFVNVLIYLYFHPSWVPDRNGGTV